MDNRNFAPADVSLMEDELWTLAVKLSDLDRKWNGGQVNETERDPAKYNAELKEIMAATSDAIVKILGKVS
jgi:hypothetical protein